MHILIISSGYPSQYEPLDGIFYKDQAEALTVSGHQVGIVSTIPVSVFSWLKLRKNYFGKKKSTVNGVYTLTHTYLNIPKMPTFCVKMAVKLGLPLFDEYINEKGKPTVIHLHCYEGGELAIAIQKKYGIPFYITEHSSRFLLNSIPKRMEAIAQTVFSAAKTRIAVSNFLKETLEKKYKLPFHFVPNSVDTEVFSADEQTVKNTVFTFLHVAGLNENKNQALLLRAFAKVISAGWNVQLQLIGDGPLKEKLVALASELGISDCVHFLGAKSRNEIPAYYKQAHAFVLSSNKETFGVVLIEAMSAGLPIVSTKSGGPESIISSANLGVLCDLSEESLYLALTHIYKNYIQFDPIKIRQHANEYFSRKAIVENLNKLYRE
jgi:glycosyltransferase involved in cell wall biosynthesis